LFRDEYGSNDFYHENELKERIKNQFWDETFWISFSESKKINISSAKSFSWVSLIWLHFLKYLFLV
jgi:hypothetical protein